MMKTSTFLLMFGLVTICVVVINASGGYFAENCDEECAESCESGVGCCGTSGDCEGECYCQEYGNMDQCGVCTGR